jgi:cytochrome c biogenesis protein CcmG/thiol:disulfide interchange protein DsbE
VKRRIVPLVSIALAAAVIAMLAWGLAAQGASRSLDAAVQRGQRPAAPEVSRALPVLNGVPAADAALSRWRGQVLVINFWASWCDTCAAEAPLLQAAQSYLVSRREGTVLGVTYKDISGSSLSWLAQHRLSFPNLRDIDGSFAEGYGTAQLPETFVLDRRLRVVAISRGELTSRMWLMRAIRAAAQA